MKHLENSDIIELFIFTSGKFTGNARSTPDIGESEQSIAMVGNGVDAM